MKDKDYPYFEMHNNKTDISFELWKDKRSVAVHRHDFFELIIVSKGSCRHFYRNTETLLVAGDCVLVDRHEPHGFSLSGETHIYLMQFSKQVVKETMKEGLLKIDALISDQNQELLSMLNPERTIVTTENKEKYYSGEKYKIESVWNSTKQGVLHLPPALFRHLIMIYERCLNENDFPILSCYMDAILLELMKEHKQTAKQLKSLPEQKQQMIAELLLIIEENPVDDIDFNAYAEKCYLSPNYFRTLFKEFTGYSPVTYQNRVRIKKACQLIENGNVTINEAAEMVGIYDQNYFSRLFKKVIGCAPRKYKS